MLSHRKYIVSAVLLTSLSLAACASTPEAPAEKAEFKAMNDPLEPTNRYVFEFNDFLDRLLIAPLAGLYRATVPPPIRERVANILSNMSEPVIFANNLLQGDLHKAGITAKRFAANTVVGVGGVFEVANDWNLPQQHGDFGQTLYTWGAGSGPYIVLPLFGPSNVRDAVGLGVDTLMSPWKYAVATGGATTEDTFMITDTAASALTRREAVLEAYDSLKEGSLDFYAQMRSVYRQHRAKELGEKQTNEMPKFDDYDSESYTPVVH
ncbi:MAG: VacJ family lipoprotein [Alphaproteobacteria bacterium]|nr:VacJ family lipoprotein [Alphaproteobacteria bacterium]